MTDYGCFTTSRICLRNAYSGQFWGVLGDFDPLNCVIVVLTTKFIRTSREEARFEILRVKIGPAVSHVALFKY